MAKSDHGRVRVSVTEQDIAKAQRNNSMRCVVAQAIARTIPDATRVDVDVQTVRWSQDGERMIFLTPYSVAGYVIAFDAGDEIEPFTFELRRRVPIRKTVTTEAGKARDRARNTVRRAKQQEARTARAVAAGEATPQSADNARAKVKEAEARLEGVKAAYEGQVTIEREAAASPEHRTHAPGRVHKSSERHYGMRRLRVNQK